MSYGVMAYLVDTQELLNLSNSKIPRKSMFDIFKPKKNVREDIIENYKPEFDNLDVEIRQELENDDSFDPPLSSTQVLDEFLNKKISEESYPWVYAYVFKILCQYKGIWLNNNDWYPSTSESFYSIPVSFFELPIQFPIPDDFPSISFIPHDLIQLAALRDNKFEGIEDAQIPQLKKWYEIAFNEKKDIYIFYH